MLLLPLKIMGYNLEIPAHNRKHTQLSQKLITITQKSYMLQQTLPVV
jgi:hypothetical protein